MVLVFGVVLRWVPIGGYVAFTRGPGGVSAAARAPAVTLAFSLLGIVGRITRGSVLEVMHQEYVRTARAKGLSEARVLTRHVLRTALIPIVTVIGVQFGILIGGTVLVEYVFNWPGISTLLFTAIQRRDYPTVQGVVLVTSGLFILINMVVDLSYAALDPQDPIRGRRVRRRDPTRRLQVVLSAAVVAVVVAAAVFPGLFTGTDPLLMHPSIPFAPPGGAYLLGTDEFGRDLFSRIVYGARPVARGGRRFRRGRRCCRDGARCGRGVLVGRVGDGHDAFGRRGAVFPADPARDAGRRVSRRRRRASDPDHRVLVPSAVQPAGVRPDPRRPAGRVRRRGAGRRRVLPAHPRARDPAEHHRPARHPGLPVRGVGDACWSPGSASSASACCPRRRRGGWRSPPPGTICFRPRTTCCGRRSR